MNKEVFTHAGIDPGTNADRTRVANAYRNGESLAHHAIEAFLEIHPPTAEELEGYRERGVDEHELEAAWVLGMLLNHHQIEQALKVWRCAELHMTKQEVPEFTLSDVVQLCTLMSVTEWQVTRKIKEYRDGK
jgi:hypothetical protein